MVTRNTEDAPPGGFQPRSDFHIHSGHSHDGSSGTTLASIRRESRAAGIREIGISDHGTCGVTHSDLRASRAEYDALEDRENFLFGIEVGTLREWDLQVEKERGETAKPNPPYDGGPKQPPHLYLPDEMLEELKFDYIIAGAHQLLGVSDSDTEAVVRNWHEQQMYIVTHPHVDVLVHPWSRLYAEGGSHPGASSRPRPTAAFGVIPRCMHEELAAAAREHNTAVEINALYPPQEQYLEFYHLLKDAGIKFSIGSDSHGPGYDHSKVLGLAKPLESLKLTDADLWHPSAK